MVFTLDAGGLSYLGLEEVDGDAVVFQTVDPQLASARRRQRLPGDELQQADQSDASLQLCVDVSQLHLLLNDMMTGGVNSQQPAPTTSNRHFSLSRSCRNYCFNNVT